MSYDEGSDTEHDNNKIINLSQWQGLDQKPANYPSTNDQSQNKDEDTSENFFIIDNFLNDPELRRSTWVRDDLVNSCEICRSEFSIFRRKHHCRCCGNIFCYGCTKFSIQLPDLDRTNVKNSRAERVCSFCYKKIVDFRYLENIYTMISHLPLELGDLHNLYYVSRTWNRVTKYYQANYKKIIHKKYSETFTKWEMEFLWLNRRTLVGHSNWALQLIRTIECYYQDRLKPVGVRDGDESGAGCGGSISNSSSSSDNKITPPPEETLALLQGAKRVKCQSLNCLNLCQPQLGTEEAILCLALPFKNLISEPYLMEVLRSGSVPELLCYLPILVDILKWRDPENSLVDYLLEVSRHNYEFANFLFWEITLQMEDQRYEILYENLRCRLTEYVSLDLKELLKNSFYFVQNLTEMVQNREKFPTLLASYFETLSETNVDYILSPVNPGIKLNGIQKEGVRIRGSSSKPVSIPFKSSNGLEIYELLYKKDDVRKDVIIMNIIKLVDIILKREEGLDLYITTYNILPISSDSGFIQIVDNAETILGINKRKGFSILNFILEHNPEKSVDGIRERFTKSCVAYCILSYLLGIGDRHMENIMVKTSGEIFHIDFGFILGADPKPLAPEIRITDEMVDAMGGYESKHYAQFKELCARSFLCLRRHVGIFRCLFSSFTRANPPIDKKLTKDYIEKFINNKFLVGERVGNAKLYLINKVSNRSLGYSESLIDFCHQAQDSTSVINSSLTNSAMNLGSSLLGMFWR